MSKMQVISCRSLDEMEKTADRMSRQGYIVKTVVRTTPFHLYGLCMREFKVVIRDETMVGNRVGTPGFLKRILRRTIWRSDLHKTSALSENSAL